HLTIDTDLASLLSHVLNHAFRQRRGGHATIHSFPTRRSSDLDGTARKPVPVAQITPLVDSFARHALLQQRDECVAIEHALSIGGEPRVSGQVGASCRQTKVGELRSEEHTSELQSRENLVCRLLLE